MGRYYSFDANVRLQKMEGGRANDEELESQDVVASVFWEERQVQKVVNFIVDSDGDADMEYFHHKHPDLYHEMCEAAKLEYADMMARFSPGEDYKIQSVEPTFPDEIYYTAEGIIAERLSAEVNDVYADAGDL
ncbi:MAG: hypothetical protein IKG99_03865 [Bacteroidaceae bacterium]|nr:hypothetical protein [Bacteroidaceae bacterium]